MATTVPKNIWTVRPIVRTESTTVDEKFFRRIENADGLFATPADCVTDRFPSQSIARTVVHPSLSQVYDRAHYIHVSGKYDGLARLAARRVHYRTFSAPRAVCLG
ncbi:hypothetical protein GCM10023147_39050 [Tsukamurella soli]|uniref:Uncharacterized protein n=1 Tax=Tsukamurella soli TaxID=644556 RepID=A0ABP8K4L4_9ACTN